LPRHASLLLVFAIGAAWALPRLIRDVRLSPDGDVFSAPSRPVVIGNVAYFRACTQATGCELWRTDGTQQGTHLVVDLRPGPAGVTPDDFTVVGSLLYFSCDDGLHGKELCVSDGTAAGTRVIDVYPGMASSFIRTFCSFQGQLYFSANRNLSEGIEMLRYDGVSAVPTLLKDINPGSANSNPVQCAVGSDHFYFLATDNTAGTELWVSDGTTAGTQLVADVSTPANPRFFAGVTALGDRAVFQTRELISRDGILWVAGPAPGPPTQLMTYSSVIPDFPGGVELDGGLLFTFWDTSGSELWRTDGTPGGTGLLKDLSPGTTGSDPHQLTRIGNRVWFSAGSAPQNVEPWITDGTTAGTLNVADVMPGGGGSYPSGYVALGADTYFLTVAGASLRQLWKSDGTAVGTSLVANFQYQTYRSVDGLTALGSEVLAMVGHGVNGAALWKLGGAPDAGTVIAHIDRRAGSDPRGLTRWRGATYFSADDSLVGRELWRTDGTPAGTQVVRDITAGIGSSDPAQFLPMGDFFLFVATVPGLGYELWRSDGTTAGTALVKDINPGPSGSWPHDFAVLDGVAYFNADTAASGQELWRSDGTNAGTWQVAELYPGTSSAYPSRLTALHGKLFFNAYTPANFGSTGFIFHGADAGPMTLSAFSSGLPGGPADVFVEAGDRVLISASAGVYTLDPADGGAQLFLANRGLARPGYWPGRDTPQGKLGPWTLLTTVDSDGGTFLLKTDGTLAGTTWLTLPSAMAQSWEEAGGYTYFILGESKDGWPTFEEWSIWRTDGTQSGTSQVTPMLVSNDPTASIGLPLFLHATDAGVFYSRWTADAGLELWSAGSAGENPTLYADIAPGPPSSSPRETLRAGPALYLVASDGDAGYEPWVVDLPLVDTTPPTILVQTSGPSRGGWFNGTALIDWTVWDDESPVISAVGCTDTQLTTDTAAMTYQCTATSAGGTASRSVTVKRDAAPPVVVCPAPLSFTSLDGGAVAASYVALATDFLSGVEQVDLAPPSPSSFAPGVHTVTATANDFAGNQGACTFEINVAFEPPEAGVDAGTQEDAGLPKRLALIDDRLPRSCGCSHADSAMAAAALLLAGLRRKKQRGGQRSPTTPRKSEADCA
jgi:ELWxxDGT repeat protein